jgi:hypothetical protein
MLVSISANHPHTAKDFSFVNPEEFAQIPSITLIMFGSSYPCCHLCGRVQHLLKRWSCWMAPLSRCFFAFGSGIEVVDMEYPSNKPPPQYLPFPGGSGGSAQRVGTGKKKWSNGKAGEIIEEG